jgi:hypothetical protein
MIHLDIPEADDKATSMIRLIRDLMRGANCHALKPGSLLL